jgi:hypothetical protein
MLKKLQAVVVEQAVQKSLTAGIRDSRIMFFLTEFLFVFST